MVTPWTRGVAVGDVIFVAVGVVAFAVLMLFVKGVDRL
jgi:hypothetical protein